MAPSGTGRPVVASHHSPRSTSRRRPYEPKVKRPSWMMTPASTSPAATAGMMRSNGITTRCLPAPVNRPESKRGRGQLSRDGHPRPAEGVGERRHAPRGVGRAQAGILAGHDQRTAPAPKRSSGVQQRVPIAQVAERVERDLDDVRLAARGQPVERVDVLKPLRPPAERRVEVPATQAWKMNVSLGQGE